MLYVLEYGLISLRLNKLNDCAAQVEPSPLHTPQLSIVASPPGLPRQSSGSVMRDSRAIHKIVEYLFI